jgi:hypothetical protein
MLTLYPGSAWQGDVFDPASWKSQLDGAIGVISTLGGFGSNEHMYKVPCQLLPASRASRASLWFRTYVVNLVESSLTVGHYPSAMTPHMLLQICGQSNIQLMEAAKEAGVDRFAFVSAHNMGLPGGVCRHPHEAVITFFKSGQLHKTKCNITRPLPGSLASFPRYSADTCFC